MTDIVGLHGMSMKANDWLVIPLDALMHTGNLGIDSGMGVETWELRFGQQVHHLDEVCRLIGYSIWEHAGINRPIRVRRTT